MKKLTIIDKLTVMVFILINSFPTSHASQHYQWNGYPYCEYAPIDTSQYAFWKDYPYCKYYRPVEGNCTFLKPHKEKLAITARIKPVVPIKKVMPPIRSELSKTVDIPYENSIKFQISASSWILGAKNLDILLGVNDKLEFGLALYEKNDRFKYGIKSNYFVTGGVYQSGFYVMGSFFYQPEKVDYERHNHPIVGNEYYEVNLAVYYQWQLPIFNHIFTSVGAGYNFRDKINPYFNWNVGVWL